MSSMAASSATSVTLDPSVVEIPDGAFSHFEMLEEVELDNGQLRAIGRKAFEHCTKLKRVHIPDTVTFIDEGAFAYCRGLEEARLPEGVDGIEEETFRGCRQLRICNVPSTIERIGANAFRGTLAPIDLPDSLRSMGQAAFNECKFRTIRVPRLVSRIGVRTFWSCRRLFSVELPQDLELIHDNAFLRCISLRNVVLPPNCGRGGDGCFGGCDDLMEVFGSKGRVRDALASRFDGLPVHKVVYYHSYLDADAAIDRVQTIISANAIGDDKLQDCLGMTPLHILACSKKQRVRMYELLLRTSERQLVTKDRWGCLPLFYALLSGAPVEILNLLFDNHPSDSVGVRKMLFDLARYGAPLDSVEFLLGIRHEAFPIRELEWDEFIDEMAASDKEQRVPIETFRFLVQYGLSERLDRIGVREWRLEIKERIGRIPNSGRLRGLNLGRVKLMLSLVEDSYRRLREAASALELALWKAKLGPKPYRHRNKKKSRRNKSKKRGKKRHEPKRKREAESRRRCRVNCGAEVVIPNVLQFLVISVDRILLNRIS
ncbi:hypothetical protein ACHAWF_003076 [Thalassiosira exigua]